MAEAWRYDYMWDSPKGHEIEKISGNPDVIDARGRAIKSLGEQMQQAANTLQLLADDRIGKGLSLDELREQSGEVYKDLRKAGERYAPSGQILIDYASALETAKSQLDSIVDDCVTLWATVKTRANSADDAAYDAQTSTEPDTGTGPDPVEQANDKVDAALTLWQNRAADYDGPYDTWDDAYEKAVNGLQKVNDDGVHDGFWDNVAPALEFLLTVLEIAGLVLLVCCLVIGGPIFAALATIVALLTLLVTIGLMFSGRKDMGDLAWAVIGILPFGKLGKFAKLGDEALQSTARFPKLATFGKLFIGGDDFAKTAQHLANIRQEAMTAWTAGGHLVPYGHLSVISQMVHEGSAGLSYIGRQTIEWGITRPVIMGRLTGIDNPMTASVADIIGGMGEGMIKNTMQNLDTVMGWVDDIESGNRAESYR